MFTTDSPIKIPEQLPGDQKGHMATPFSPEIFDLLNEAIAAIKAGGKPGPLGEQFASALNRTADEAFETFFMQPMSEIKLNATVRKSAEAGMNAALKAVHVLIRQMFKKMSMQELRTFAEYMETLMLGPDAKGVRYLGYQLKQPLYDEVWEIIHRIQTDENTDSYSAWIVGILHKLVDEAIDAYYRKPADLAKMGMLKRKTADVGVATATKGAKAVIKQLFKKTRQKEMLKFAGFLQDVIIVE